MTAAITKPFPTDRQADAPMAEFVRLARDLIVEGYDVSGTLRYPFFVDCVRSERYQSYSLVNLVYTLVTASVWDFKYTPADILFAQEGLSERKQQQITPLVERLTADGHSAAVIHQVSSSRGRRLALGALRAPQNIRFIRELPGLFDQAETIRKAFDLSANFKWWFVCQVLLALREYQASVRLLGTMSPRPKAVVVHTEYHHTSRALLTAAQAQGIPTVLIQHGFLGQEWLHWPIISQKVCVYGEVDRQWYIQRGLAEDRLAVIGSHRAPIIKPARRMAMRKQYVLTDDERAIVFFAPNLSEAYHIRAANFLKGVAARLDPCYRWFVRLHPSQLNSAFTQHYANFQVIPTEVFVDDVFAMTDLVLHDYSTMAFAEFAGIPTACLALDPPYPAYYPALLGDQPEVDSADDLYDILAKLPPMTTPTSRPTAAMAAGEDDALTRACQAILSVTG